MINKCCAISIDMDPIYHYLLARNLVPQSHTNLGAIYDDALPRFLHLFDKFDVKATFFIVGKDAIINKNRVREIEDCGHEVANHSYNHFQHFNHLEKNKKKVEIENADQVLSDIIGKKIHGFRAPGWGIDNSTIDILEENDYSYDSSVFSSKILLFILIMNWLQNRGKLRANFTSSFLMGMSPKIPYHPDKERIWKKGNVSLLELPPTILPILQIPFLGTILFMLGEKPFFLSHLYFNLFNRHLLYELHGIELVDYYTQIMDERLLIKPGLGKTIDEKIKLYHIMLSTFSDNYRFVTMKELSDLFSKEGKNRG